MRQPNPHTLIIIQSCSNLTSDIDTTITDRTNLSNDGTEKTDRGIDDTGGISSVGTYAL